MVNKCITCAQLAPRLKLKMHTCSIVRADAALRLEWLAPGLVALVCGPGHGPAHAAALVRAVAVERLDDGIYSFDLFDTAFCATLAAEIDTDEATCRAAGRT